MDVAREQLIRGKLTCEKLFSSAATAVQCKKTFLAVRADSSFCGALRDHFRWVRGTESGGAASCGAMMFRSKSES